MNPDIPFTDTIHQIYKAYEKKNCSKTSFSNFDYWVSFLIGSFRQYRIHRLVTKAYTGIVKA